jgi:alpha-ketoglutarate-dependent taurine dioxygenase
MAQIFCKMKSLFLKRFLTTSNFNLTRCFNIQNYAVKQRPKNLNEVKIRLKHVNDLKSDYSLVNELCNKFNEYGFVVLCPDECSNNLVSLGGLLGKRAQHERINEEGVLVIDPKKSYSINHKNTHMDHLPHTDESFLDKPSKVMALQCIEPVKSGHGQTVLVYGSEMMDYLRKKKVNQSEIDALFNANCLTVERTLPGLGEGRCSSFPIFKINKDRVEMKWRCKDSYIKRCEPEAVKAFDLLNDFACNPVHQLKFLLEKNQIILVDNMALAHGRTRYDGRERRVLWRLNYMNDGLLSKRLVIGFPLKIPVPI